MKKRILIFTIILLVVCAAMLLFVTFGGGSLVRMRYKLSHGISGESNAAPSVTFDESNQNVYSALDSGLAVSTSGELCFYTLSGDKKLNIPLAFRAPSISSEGKNIIIYDRNGTGYIIANTDTELARTATEAQITHANINKSGYYTIVTEDSDFKSAVSVFSSERVEIYKFYSSEQYLFDAVLNESSNLLAAIGFSASDGVFGGSAVICSLTEETPLCTVKLSSMPLKARFYGNSLVVICEDSIVRVTSDGTSETLASFSNIIDLSQGSNLSCALSSGKLTICSSDGKTSVVDCSEPPIGVSSAGKYVALWYSDRAVVYSSDGVQLNETPLPADCESCAMREDGTLLVICSNSAKIIIF